MRGGTIKVDVPKGTVRLHPARIELVPVMDRGATYMPPRTHLGVPIDKLSPILMAQLAFRYLDGLIREAEERFGSKAP